jgi:hypothetical protein
MYRRVWNRMVHGDSRSEYTVVYGFIRRLDDDSGEYFERVTDHAYFSVELTRCVAGKIPSV